MRDNVSVAFLLGLLVGLGAPKLRSEQVDQSVRDPLSPFWLALRSLALGDTDLSAQCARLVGLHACQAECVSRSLGSPGLERRWNLFPLCTEHRA